MKTMIIYVVMGYTGEYSDRRNWPVGVLSSKQRAEDYSFKAEKRAKEIEEAKGDKHNATEEKNEFDPDMKMYTSTGYYVMEVPIIENTTIEIMEDSVDLP